MPSRRAARLLAAVTSLVTLAVAAGCGAFGADSDDEAPRPPEADAGLDGPGPSGPGTRFAPGRELLRTAPGLRGVAVDGTRLYFTNEDTGEVSSLAKDGTAPVTLARVTAPTDIVADATRVYWVDTRGPGGVTENAYRTTRKDASDLQYGPAYEVSKRIVLIAGHRFRITRRSDAAWYVLRDEEDVLAALGFSLQPKCVTSNGITTFFELEGKILTVPAQDGGASLALADAADMVADEGSLYWIPPRERSSAATSPHRERRLSSSPTGSAVSRAWRRIRPTST